MTLLDELFPNAKGKLTVRFSNTVKELNPAILDDPRVSVGAEIPLYVARIEDDLGNVTTLTVRNY